MDVNHEIFNFNFQALKAGYNSKANVHVSGSDKEYSLLIERRVCELSLENLMKLKLKEDFIGSVKSLPSSFIPEVRVIKAYF